MTLKGNKQIAEYLGISVKTFITWRDREGIPYCRVGGAIYSSTEEIEKWLERRLKHE